MARTAVIAGTANATVGAMNRRQAGKAQAAANDQAAQQAAFESQAQLAEMQAQMDAMKAPQAQATAPPPPPAPAPAPAAAGGDMMAELQKLADMKAAGILTDDEFAAAKAKLLA
jgi:hypothetical protein